MSAIKKGPYGSSFSEVECFPIYVDSDRVQILIWHKKALEGALAFLVKIIATLFTLCVSFRYGMKTTGGKSQ